MDKIIVTPSWGKVLAAVFVAVLVLAGQCFAYNQGDPEFRAVCVDAWGAGYMNQGQVDKLLGVVGDPNSKGDVRNANCNAVIVEVRRRADACYPSSMGEPYMTGLSPANFNALQAMINAAHDTTGNKQRIEVHAWLVTFATASGATGPVYYAHNNPADADNYWPTRDNAGNETSDKAFDPGHPKCEEYTVNVAMDLVNNFDIDGVHFDYIRFTGENQGYNPTSIERYNARYGLTGQPSYSSEQFKQWRRDQVTAVVRKVYAKTQASKPAVKVSGSFVTWNPSPTASTRAAFQGTRPYYQVYSDWDAWQQEGILDAAIPMNYYNWTTYPNDYIRWCNFCKDRKFNRHMYLNVSVGMNSLSNAILELNMTRDPSPAGNYSNGLAAYCYRVPYSGGTWEGFSPSFVSQVANSPVPVPVMPWKTSPTKGHISGTVTHAPVVSWADGATVSISGPENRSMLCDGTGFYAFIDLTPGTYTVTASKAGCVTQQRQVVVQIGAVTGNMYVTDFALVTAPIIANVRPADITTNSAAIAWDTDQASSSQVQYGLTPSYGSTTTLDSTQVTAHSVVLGGLAGSTLYHYRVTSANGNGSRTSADYTFITGSHSVTLTPNPGAGGACTGSGWYVTGTSVSASAAVNPGYYFASWSTNPDGTGVVSRANPYVFNMPAGNYSLYANFQTSVLDIIIESEVGGLNHDWYSEVGGWAHSTSKSSAAGVTGGIGSRYGGIDQYYNKDAHYKPEIAFGGWYKVWVTWCTSSGGSDIKHTVTYNGGQYTTSFNQSQNANAWNYIGSFPFVAGSSGNCGELKQWIAGTESLKRIMADAAKWVYVGPFKAVNPVPANGATGVSADDLMLSWTAGGTTGSYDVYFGASPGSMVKVSSLQTGTTYTPDALAPTTTYYWRVDSIYVGKLTTGDTWSFTTAAVPPTVTIGPPSAALTKSGPITYMVTYGGATTVTLASGNVTLNKTGTANGNVAVSGSGLVTRTVTISGITGTGTLGVSIAAGTAGALAPAAGPSTTFAVDNTAPVINSVVVSPPMAAVGDSVHTTVDATDNVDVTSVTANGTALAKSTGNTWAGDIFALSPLGVQGVTIVANDAAGNSATNTSATYKAAQVVGTSSGAAWRAIMESARGIYLFKFWGKVTVVDDDNFTLSDGSAVPITVHAPGYKTKVQTGDYASARGILNIAGSARWIESELGLIVKY